MSILLGTVLLAILIWKIGLQALWQELSLLGWALIPLILAQGLANVFYTKGWRYCLSGPNRSLSFPRLYCIRMAGTSINVLTPTATLGGEVTKGTLLASNHRGPEAATAVIIGKLAFALAQLHFVLLGSVVIVWKVQLPLGVRAAMLAASALLGAGILGFLVVQKYGKLGAILRWLAARKVGGVILERAADHITQVDQTLRIFYKERPRDLPLAILWHILGFGCGIAQSWLFLFLLTDQPSLLMAAGVWCLGEWMDLVSFALPNVGVLEATRVLTFRALGFSSTLGLTYGIILRLEKLFWAGVGLLMYAWLLAEKSQKKAIPEVDRSEQYALRQGLER